MACDRWCVYGQLSLHGGLALSPNFFLVAASQKTPVSGPLKRKSGRPWVELEIRAWGLASHPRAHARAKYGLVPTNYAVSRADSYSFPLEAIELQT